MEPSFTSVRQMVADRVLDRHLRDLADKHVAVEMAQKQRDIRLMERELLVGTQRNRPSGASDAMYPAMSLPAPPSEVLIPSPRRHSLPSTQPPTARTQKHHAPYSTAQTRDFNKDGRDGDTSCRAPNQESGSAGRKEASLPADQHPFSQHHPHTREYPIDSRPDAPLTGTSKAKESKTRGILKLSTTQFDTRMETVVAGRQTSSNKVPSLDPCGPILEKGETFVKTDTFQVLSFQDGSDDFSDESPEEAGAEAAGSETHGGISAPQGGSDVPTRRASLSTAKRTSLSSQQSSSGGIPSAASVILRQAPLLPRRRSLHVTVPTAGSEEGLPGLDAQTQRRRSSGQVEIYNEGTGLRDGDEGGFTPHNLRLPLHLLHDGSNDYDGDVNVKTYDTGQWRKKGKGRREGEEVLAEKEVVVRDENLKAV